MTIYELSYEFKQLQDMAENGEIGTEEFGNALAELDYQLEIKADGYARIVKNLEAEADAYKKAADEFSEKHRRTNARIAALKTALKEALQAANTRQVKTELFDVRIQANGGKNPLILDCTPDQLPDELVRIKREADSEKIAKYIEKTGDVSYAHFGERGESLRIK